MDDKAALKLIQEDYDESEYEELEGWVDDGHLKHDITCYHSIFLRKADSTYWKVDFTSSYNYGLSEDLISAYEVEKKEVVTVEWVAK